MTRKEKLKELHPELDQHDLYRIMDEDCPTQHFAAYIPDCHHMGCDECWKQEYVEPTDSYKHSCVQKAYDLMVGFHNGKTTDIEEVIGYLGQALDDHPEEATTESKSIPICHELQGVGIDTPEKFEKAMDAVRDIVSGPTIKDSGDRTQFETGAVRDMREGKGRCDLIPLEVVARMRGNHDGQTNMFEYISRFQNTNETHHLVKALFKFAEEAYGGTERTSMCTMLLEVAKHFEEGAKKYGPDNWRRGIPVYCYIDSALRHYIKWLRGDKAEPHDRAFVWNLMCCIWEVDHHKKEES